ncbi:MAG: ShlB/FhaC/HecB family hemolysin secretion/activation protein [Verrucomicrobiota bacterium]
MSRIAPKPLESKPGILSETKPTEEVEESNATFLKEFKGLVLWEEDFRVRRGGKPGVRGLEASMNLKHRDLLEKLVKAYLNQPLSAPKLERLKQAIESHFRNEEEIWVRVITPEQKLEDGVLQMLIIKSSIGKINVEGGQWFKASDIQEEFHLKPGDPIQDQKMAQELDWINRNPFRQADLYLAPGDSQGKSDVTLKLKDRFPVRFYTGYEDSGNTLTGRDRYLAGLNWGDAFLQGHQMSYQYTTSYPANRFIAHSGNYVIPLPWHHELEFLGAYSEAEGTQADFGIKGKSWQASGRYRIPLPTLREIHQEVALGYDFKQSNNNLEFGGTNVFTHLTDVSQFVGEYQGSLKDSWGSTTWGTKWFLSPGGMSENNEDKNFKASRANAYASYAYGQIELERRFQLPWGFSTRHSALYQWSSGNLLGSEQLGVGGRDTVRGYEEREANGDEGYLFQNEIWSPAGSAADLLTYWGVSGLSGVHDRLQGLVFWDYGVVQNRVLLSQEDREKVLSSVGVGLRYTINTYLSCHADYGFQLFDLGEGNLARIHMSFVVSY